MDLLYRRYASPFSFLDAMIQADRFDYFVLNFYQEVEKEKNEQMEWEFFLHKVEEGSFDDFREELQNRRKNMNMSESDIEATLKHTMNIMKNFKPDT